MKLLVVVMVVGVCAYGKPKFRPEGLSAGVQGDQDGGRRGAGTVIEMREWKGEPNRKKFGVRVVWDNGNVNTYRWGAEDRWDVEVIGKVDAGTDLRALRDSAPPIVPPPPEPCTPEELDGLRSVYKALGGSKWRTRAGWDQFDDVDKQGRPVNIPLNRNPCRFRWTGVVCVDGHVHALDVSNNNAVGQLPDTLSALPHLVTLSVGSNKITGPLPRSLMTLSKLRWLNYQNNRIEGPLGDGWAQLKQLEWLSASNNLHTGTLPAELGYLDNMKHMRLNHNNFEGTIPQTFVRLRNLEGLNLQNTGLSGSLPVGLADLENLKFLRYPPKVRRLTRKAPHGDL